MSEDEGLELLLSRSGRRKNEEKEGMEIVRKLGFLALAIDQAGAYISARKLNLHQYMDAYNKRKEKVLRETPHLWEYRRKLGDTEGETSLSVFTTWEMSFEQIGRNNNDRVKRQHLLTLLAFLDNNAISEEMFQVYFESKGQIQEWMDLFGEARSWDRYEFQDVIAELVNSSLLQSLEYGSAGSKFSLHPLVRDWVKLRIGRSAQQQFTKEAILILTVFIDAQKGNELSLQVRQEIHAHLDTCIQNDSDFLDREDGLGFGSLRYPANRFADFYNLQCHQLGDAERLYRRALEGEERQLGPDHSGTLQTAQSLARIYARLNRLGEAERLCKRVLKSRERQLGPNHPDTLYAVVELAVVYQYRDRCGDAERLCRRALEANERRLGSDHPNTLRTVERLAGVYSTRGRYEMPNGRIGGR